MLKLICVSKAQKNIYYYYSFFIVFFNFSHLSRGDVELVETEGFYSFCQDN